MKIMMAHNARNFIIILSILSFIFAWQNNYIDFPYLFNSNTIDYANNHSLDLPPPIPINTDIISAPSKNLIWQEIVSEFQLDHHSQSIAVQNEIKKMLANPNDLQRILQAAAPYLYYIHQQIKQKSLPGELALIPFIESEYNPYDHSSKGAKGIWQLMAGTAKELGIKVVAGYDGRRNLISSTNAALAYFSDLGTLFHGNWYLAIAAYNCGQGKVFLAQRKVKSNNFWKLPLPKETRLYVPRLLAIASIIKNHQKYGVNLPEIHNKPFFKEVPLQKKMNLAVVSKTTHVDIKVLKKLNPDYNAYAITTLKKYSLLIPA